MMSFPIDRSLLLCCSLLFIPFFVAPARAASAAQIANALDAPAGIVFSASNAGWTLKTNSVADITPAGVPSFNNTYLVCPSPGSAEPQKQSFFTMTLKGAGTLSFRYQVSLDDWNWAELCAYENDYFEGWLWGDSGYWDENVGLGWEWWKDADFMLGTETYTHNVTFAVTGPTSLDYTPPEPDPDFGEKLYKKVWLDHFVWEPDEDVDLLAFDPDPEEFSSFNETLTVYLLSDYNNLVFRYTTDGSAPTADSPVYDPDAGITITGNTTISAIVYENSTLVNNTVYQASYQLRTPPPLPRIIQNEFQDSALLKFSSSAPGAVFYYTLNNNVPIRLEHGAPGENTFIGSQVTLNATVTVQVMARAEGLADSDVIMQTFEKLPAPAFTCILDGNAVSHPFFDTDVQVNINAPPETTVKYQINGGNSLVYQNPLTYQETTEIRFQAQQEGKLHSNTVTLKFFRTNLPFTLPVPAHGWSLLFLPGEISKKNSDELIAQWQPIAYDSKKKIYFRPDLLRGGNSYWIFKPQGGTRIEPSNFPIFPLPGISLPAKTWLLSGIPEGTSLPADIQAWTWNKQTFLPASPLPPGPAWLYNTGNAPAELTP